MFRVMIYLGIFVALILAAAILSGISGWEDYAHKDRW